MRKSKYLGKIINNMKILETKNELNENGKKRFYFVVECLKCHKKTKKDRFSFLKGESKCECSYKNEPHKIKGHTRLYNIWCNMNARCNNVNHPRYRLYGQRGIKVMWKNYNSFYEWAINNGYKDDLSIDRINVNGNYEPSNCRWVNQKIQCNNSRRNHYITYKGKTQSMSQWADELGIGYYVLRSRINKNWSIERAFNQKVRKTKKLNPKTQF